MFGIALGADRVFDVRFGDWFESDPGNVVVWVASKSSVSSVQARLEGHLGRTARVYPAGSVPFGVSAPAGAVTIWAVIARGPVFPDDRACVECTPAASEPHESYAAYLRSCICLPAAR